MNLDSNSDSLDPSTNLSDSHSNEAQELLADSIVETFSQLTGESSTDHPTDHSTFVPIEPESLQEAGLTELDVESIILKYLASHGHQQGRQIAKHIKLPFGIIQEILKTLKTQMFITYKSLTAANDYVYELTEPGFQRAQRLNEICSYCGAAPVGFDKYVESVKAQSLRNHRLSEKEVADAFGELFLSRELIAQLGQAVNSGRCMFLYGSSGNGKTSIATRCVDAYDSGIWIPRTLTIGGEIIRLFDPTVHEELPPRKNSSLLKKSVVDERWVRIKRPKVIVGGELTFAQLEIAQNRFTGVLEAPIQMKSNNGCLVIDDFGRQRITTAQLLNRWIIPLENGTDYIRLPNGRKIESPFEQMLVFSTNLEPDLLADDAFYRRIPYKIELREPTAEQFGELFQIEAARSGFELTPGVSEYLIQTLEQNHGSLKYCYVRDILEQCHEFCEYHNRERTLDKAMVDLAIHNYFAGL